MRQKSDTHRAFIASLPCLVCGNNIESEACHIRMGDLRVAKPANPGTGTKPGDMWCVPMCGQHHRKQHTMNEHAFWRGHSIDPIITALALWAHSGDHEAGCQVVAHARHMNGGER